jgi:hypothetical protein
VAQVGRELGAVEFDTPSEHYDLRAFEVTISSVGETPMHDEVRWIRRCDLALYDLADSDKLLAREIGLIK